MQCRKVGTVCEMFVHEAQQPIRNCNGLVAIAGHAAVTIKRARLGPKATSPAAIDSQRCTMAAANGSFGSHYFPPMLRKIDRMLLSASTMRHPANRHDQAD
jgi:hypothetical protein